MVMSGVPGSGLAKGLAVTLRTMTRRSTTRQYPDVEPDLPPRSRGVIALLEENCTVCMLCARECPDWCIYIDSHKEEVVVPGAARPRQRNLHDKNRLGEWMPTVPPPPAHDVLGEPSKEEATAARKAAGPGTPTAAKTAR